jgi:integrase
VIVWKIIQQAPEKVKSNQRKPMETTPKKLLDQVCACTEPVEVTPSASRAVAGQCKHYSIHTVQELLGHKDVKTTMIYTPVLSAACPEQSRRVERHVLKCGSLVVRSPLD